MLFSTNRTVRSFSATRDSDFISSSFAKLASVISADYKMRMKKKQSKKFPIVPKLQFDNTFRQLCFQILMAEHEIAFIRATQFLFDLTKSEVWDEESPTGRRQVALPQGAFLLYIALMEHPGQRLLCSDIFPTAKPSRQPRLASRALDSLKRLLGPDHMRYSIHNITSYTQVRVIQYLALPQIKRAASVFQPFRFRKVFLVLTISKTRTLSC